MDATQTRQAATVHVVVLNYNGQSLLPECLPSVCAAAAASRHACEVVVIDNSSTDDSLAWLAAQHPSVRVIQSANHGLCSFNKVVPTLRGEVVLLLNNDIKLAPDAIDPLVAPLRSDPSCFLTAPRCWLFDEKTHEGFLTAVRWRWGLVQATGRFPGAEQVADRPGWTASVGAALAVDRRKFTALGGFDSLYLPGRLEDLDFCFRGYQAGWQARYVPAAVCFHRGMASFGPAFGAAGCDQLALRNTLLFQWKNLRHPRHLLRQLLGLPPRLLWDGCCAPWRRGEQRLAFTRALLTACRRWWQREPGDAPACHDVVREREYFVRFHPRRLLQPPPAVTASPERETLAPVSL